MKKLVSKSCTIFLLGAVLATAPVNSAEARAPSTRAHKAAKPECLGRVDASKLPPITVDSSAKSTPRLIENRFPTAAERQGPSVAEIDSSRPGLKSTWVHDADPGAKDALLDSVPAVDVSFDGPYDGGVAPPDAVVAAGLSHVVSLVNVRIAMYDKAGTLLSGPTSLRSFFGIPSGFSVFDPLAIYDPFSQRFIVATLADNDFASDSRIYIAFSQSTDPTGTWNKYFIDADAGQPDTWADYASIGIDRNAVYLTANIFTRSDAFSGVTVYIYDKEDGYAGTALDNTHLLDVRTSSGASPYRLRPAVVEESVSGDEYYLAHSDASLGSVLNIFRLSGNRFDSPTLPPSQVPLANLYFAPGGARQPGNTTGSIDTLGANLWNVYYHAGSLWMAQSVSASGDIVSRVHRVGVSGAQATLEQSFDVSATGRDTFFPYVIPDIEDNDFALCTAFSGDDLFVTGRYWNISAAGEIRGAEEIVAGTRANTSGRHGDYFSISTDPSDRNRVWMISQYMKNSSFSGNARIASARFEDVSPPVSIPPVPDGHEVAGSQVLVAKAGSAQLSVSWDASTCPAPNNHLVWLDLPTISSYTVSDETCNVGNSGSWTGPAPSGSVALLVVSDDGVSVEGSHGTDSSGSERPSSSASCGLVEKNTTGTCIP